MTGFLRLSMILAAISACSWAQVSPDINVLPTRAFGHAQLTLDVQTTSPNLLEGRELNSPTAIAFDTSVSPPVVYVADTGNHRVLAWRNPGALTLGNQADKVIGQRNFVKAYAGGPGAGSPALSSAGMTLPNGLAVDSDGNLYVLDAGNNRILRFPKPMQQQGEFVVPDLVIGQKTVNSGNLSNQGQAKPSDKTISINRGGNVARGSMAFDAAGNLWLADVQNNRVLRYPKARLNQNEPAADIVLGQSSFETDDAADTQANVVGLRGPTGLAIDSRGFVYVSDALLRTVYYETLATGATARRILGIEPVPPQGQNRPPAPNDYTLGRAVVGNQLQGAIPQCVFMLGTIPFICDGVAHRIVRYNTPESWAPATNDALSPQIAGVYGQDNLLQGGPNRSRGLSATSAVGFLTPTSGAFFNNEMWIVDSGNNRVVSFPQGPGGDGLSFPSALRVLGQAAYDTNATNLAEGKELYISSPNFRGSAIAIDRTSTPNRLYVADSLNNRVLGFSDVRTVGTDLRTVLTKGADIVIGQTDLMHTIVNYPSGDPLAPSDQGLFSPSGVAVDAQGNLWVADTGNGRLLRFPSPFNQPAGQVARANLVLGQSNFTIKITDASSSTMAAPFGVVVFNNGDLAASDPVHNRVLLWRRSGDFVNGQAARAVLGQQNFNTTNSGGTAAQLNSPRGLAVDTGDRLYVADANNGRVLIFSSTGTTANGATGTSIPNLNSPEGVAVSRSTGELWVAATGSNRVYRFREFTQLGTNPTPTAEVGSVGPFAIALDQFDNLIAAEIANRLTFYYARAVYRHAATYASGANLGPTLTPNMYTLLGRAGKSFEFTPATGSIPYAKTLGGIRVTVAGIPAPITSITSDVVYFLVPNDAPSSGEADIVVDRPETGEILAAGTFLMGPSAPGFFTANQQGNRQIAATNQNGTPNGPDNRAGQDEDLILWMTGYGHLDNAPPDGEAPGRAFPIPTLPRIIIGGVELASSKILYSGLSPEFPGLWQINIKTPKNGDPNGAPAPSAAVSIIVIMNDIRSNIGPGPTAGSDQALTVQNGLITTVALR